VLVGERERLVPRELSGDARSHGLSESPESTFKLRCEGLPMHGTDG
jgi:hypothetical protein